MLRLAATEDVMKILVACEISGIVRDAFLELGHDAWSCDVLPAERPSNRHIIADARTLLSPVWWDMLIVAHPPCTRLCKSGLRWLHKAPPGRDLADLWRELDEAADLFSTFWNAPIERICVENPDMHRHAQQRIRNYQPAAQRIQPWMFGEPAFKTLALWLKGLPALHSTDMLTPPRYGSARAKSWEKIHRQSGYLPNRARERSRFFPGVAAAMAQQWGGNVNQQIAA